MIPLRILHLEDDQKDAELVHATLEAEGLASELTRVETQPDFRTCLDQGGFDLILADYTLPSFDGMSALKIAKQASPEVPFIFVSGTLGEEVASALVNIGKSSTDALIKTLITSPEPHARENAAWALGALHRRQLI